VKKQAKKLDQILELETRSNLDADQKKKLKSKESLQSAVEQRLKIFELYKKTMSQENISHNNKKVPQNVSQPIQSEHKVIECSIL